jgi:hypothetical protein
MKLSSQPPGTPFKISDSLHQRINMYALAASAAGVSLLALSQPAEAKIVYTKTHRVIGSNGIYSLDLNQDGTVDFLIQEWTSVSSGLGFNALLVQEALGNGVAGSIVKHSTQSFHFASALKAGTRIGSGERFIHRGYHGEEMASVFQSDLGGGTFGQWVDVNNRYLGLRFRVDGKTHYGWARMSVRVQGFDITATLTGYAFETIPGKSIRAGQTRGNDDTAVGANAADSSASHANAAAESMPDARPFASLGWLARGTQGIAPKRQP